MSSAILEGSRSRTRRSGVARAYLVLIFLLLRIADAWCYYYTLDPANPSIRFRLQLVIIASWTTILLSLVWFRKRWARYLLLAFVGYVAVIDMVVIFAVFAEQQGFQLGPVLAASAQLIAYATAAAILILSKRVRKLSDRT